MSAHPAETTRAALAPYEIDPSAHPAEKNALADRIAAEIVALTRCAENVASRAGGAIVNFRSFPDFGLDASASNNPRLAYAAQDVLRLWIEAKVAEYLGAHRVAA